MPALATSLSVSGSAGTFRSMLYSIQATTGERWLSVDPNTRADAIDAVGDIPSAEFRKIFDALYQYDPPELSGIETPTLVVHGEQEAPLVKRQGRQIASAVADGTQLELAESGHLVNQDRPRAFNAAATDFLEELPLRRRSLPSGIDSPNRFGESLARVQCQSQSTPIAVRGHPSTLTRVTVGSPT